MKLGIMQPYLFPYIGYYQLINAVDHFIVYDNIQFTKKGWINRNRILVNGSDEYITLPLKKDSDYLHVAERKLAESFQADKIKLLRKISGAYKKAPEFTQVFPLVESILNQHTNNLFEFIYGSLQLTCGFLKIKTTMQVSSSLAIDHELKSQDKVLAICEHLKASEYLNPAGGLELYDKGAFSRKNIQLNFIKSNAIEYRQFENEFVPWLSIIDVMMFNDVKKIETYLQSGFTII